MGQLIDKLWETDIEFYNYSDPNIRELTKLFDNTREKLEAKMDNKQKELFAEYLEYLNEYYCEIEKKAFSNGFSLGMRMAAEAFADSEKLI